MAYIHTPVLGRLGLLDTWRAVALARAEEGPRYTGHFVRDGHTGLIHPYACDELSYPYTGGIGFRPRAAHDRTGTMNEQAPQVAIPPF